MNFICLQCKEYNESKYISLQYVNIDFRENDIFLIQI